MFSDTKYARNGDLHIAYRTSPQGPRDIVLVTNWFTNCEAFPELPSIQGWVEAMATLGRLIVFDQPGTGASDPVVPGSLPTLEQWSDSITAVLDELKSTEAVIIAMVDGALAPAALFAATHPARTTALIALECYANPVAERRDEPGAATTEQLSAAFLSMWGTGEWQQLMNPDMPWNPAIKASWARMERLAASPGTVALMFPLVSELDVRAVLPTVRVPTLILQHRDDVIATPEWGGKQVADGIPGSKYVELPGRNIYHFVEPTWRTSLQEIAAFITGQQADVVDDRVLSTVLFTDIVDSTRLAAEMGDRNWHTALDAHDAVVRSQLARFRGREVNTSGDGFLAMFDGPQRAIRCATAIRDAVQALGIEVRAGLHTGECEVRGDDIGGIAVHIGARVSALAGAGEVLVSSTVRDLVVGSGIEFEDRGMHALKGVPGEWRLSAVAL